MAGIPQVITEDRASGALVVEGSLRFNSGKGYCLKRTFTSNGNQRAWTWSGWVKRGDIPTTNVAQSLMGAYSDSNNRDVIRISGEAQDKLSYQNGVSGGYQSSTTDAVLRDTGWYHIVISVDLSEGEQTARSKTYINGRLQSASIAHGSGRDSRINGNYLHYIGARSTDGNPSAEWDGEMSQCYFIDGLQLGPGYFGFTDPLTGTWRPKKFRAEGTTINDGRTWSDNTTGTWDSTYVRTRLFDGNLGTQAYAASGSNAAAITFSDITITQDNRLRVYGGSGWSNEHSITSNGVTKTWNTSNNTVWSDLTDLFPTPWSFDSINATYNGNLRAIEVGGTILQDGLTQNLAFGTNGFYLPMDGNTLIGKDQSGNGNDWTPVKFGGSQELPKATGAIPILNTNEAGTVAKPVARTDSKTYTVTASGGKYYLDGVETPTLNFLRGGTYIFDYTGATSHPFKFSTTSDGTHNSGSEYTDGTNTSTTNVMKITVPHNAPDTLYYYCSAHSGMGSSINVTTDIRKADPYAWKCVLALPLLGSEDDISASINVNSTTKTTAITGNAESRSERWDLYGGAFYFDSTADYIEVTPTSGTTLADNTAPYTIEFFFSINSGRFTDNTYNILWSTSSGLTIAKWRSGVSNKVYFESDGNATGWNITSQENLSANTWYHFAAVRNGNTITTYLDGVLQGTRTATYSASAETWWRVGGQNQNSSCHAGYMQDFRVYNGVAKYTEDFSRVSTTPDILPDTPSGVSVKSKLTKIIDGAVSFDGTNDYLDAPTSNSDFGLSGSDDFTIECFTYATEYEMPNGSYMEMIRQGTSNAGSDGVYFNVVNDNTLQFRISGTTKTTTGKLNAGGWNHVSVCRSSGTLYMSINGVVENFGSVTNSSTTGNFRIGANFEGSHFYEGQISNVRFIKGTALYTSNFTPPTEPLTAVTNTKLLCCQSNTSAGTAAVSPSLGGINDGTVWSSGISNAASSFPGTNLFDGSTSTYVEGDTNGTNVTFSGNISGTTIEIYGNKQGSSTLTINGVDKTSLVPSSPGYFTITGVTEITSMAFNRGASGNYVDLYAIRVDGVVLRDPLIAKGDAAATNFNPFTDDINTIRGQETGYATLNPLLKGANTALSNGNLTVSSSGSTFDGFATGTILIPKTGKWFVEFTAGSVVSSTYYGMYNTRTWNPNGFSGTGFFGLQVDTGRKFKSTGQSDYGSAVTLGDVVGVMYDADNNTIGFMKNGTNYGVAFDNSDGIDYTDDHRVWWNTNAATNFSHTINFGQKPFKFPPPDGFQPLNLSTVQPEKVITRPDQYVGVSLWSGNGASQNITGLKHKPDFVWLKKRSGGTNRSHQLFDTVRGVHKSLHSNSINGEDTNTSRLTAFNQDGFTLGGDDGSNGSGGEFVGWTWKAGGSKGTFNIDDVGYANASDVNMNVGAFNNYNTSRVWSSGIANSSGDFDQPATNAFNGDRSNKLRTGGNAVLVTLNFSPALTVANTIQILGEDYATANFRYTVTVDGTTTTKDVDQGQPATFNVSGSLTQITFVNNNSNGRTYLEWIKVDGKELIDSNVTINTPSIAPTGCSVGTKQGFSIVKWQGDGSNANRTVPHGLLEAPSFIIVKPLSESRHWLIWHKGYNDDDAAMLFDTGIPAGSRFGPNAPTSNVFGVYGGQGNRGTTDFIGYCWHDVPGLQKFGTYTGNGVFDGPFVELGFQPAIIWFKNISDGSNRHWCVVDSRRTTHNKSGSCEVLFPDSSQVESRPDDGFGQFGNKTCVDILSNGFKLREPNTSGVWTQVNNTHNYIYCAWAEAPSINLYGSQSNAF